MIVNRTPPPPPDVFANRHDIQALLASGFNSLPNSRFLLLKVVDPVAARAWLAAVLRAGLVADVGKVGKAADAATSETLSIGMTHEGLRLAGVRPSTSHPFPSTFVAGMGNAQHASKLGDSATAAEWQWIDVASLDAPRASLVHWLVACYWSGGDNPAHRLLQEKALRDAGFTVMSIPGDPGFIQPDGSAIEPFGFRDGIAQPVVCGLRGGQSGRHGHISKSLRPAASDQLIAPGEFVLGYPNEYGELAYAPHAVANRPAAPAGGPRFAVNGSYLAVRQIFQDVRALRRFEASHPAATVGGVSAPTITERMLGRYRDGRPLGLPNRLLSDLDDFRYAMYDAQGFGCPRGAHVRRANPRDLLGVDPVHDRPNTRLHRLLRRGRSYALPDGEQGLFFMALNADLDRQFAFVQGQWIQQATFGELADEADPLLGTSDRNFTVQCSLLAQRQSGLPAFTRVVGGGYFFLPGLTALHDIAGSLPAEDAGSLAGMGGASVPPQPR